MAVAAAAATAVEAAAATPSATAAAVVLARRLRGKILAVFAVLDVSGVFAQFEMFSNAFGRFGTFCGDYKLRKAIRCMWWFYSSTNFPS